MDFSQSRRCISFKVNENEAVEDRNSPLYIVLVYTWIEFVQPMKPGKQIPGGHETSVVEIVKRSAGPNLN